MRFNYVIYAVELSLSIIIFLDVNVSAISVTKKSFIIYNNILQKI